MEGCGWGWWRGTRRNWLILLGLNCELWIVLVVVIFGAFSLPLGWRGVLSRWGRGREVEGRRVVWGGVGLGEGG